MNVIKLMMLGACMQIPALYAQEGAQAPAEPQPSANCEEALTVFQDVSGMGRKDRAAKNMTKRHAEMARERWRLIDMEVYTENGDLEGFYLSYVRSVACG
jgi:hypothetical protein